MPLAHIAWNTWNVDVECKVVCSVRFLPHQSLDLNFVAAPASYTVPQNPDPANWHREPYVHVLPVLCKDKNVYTSAVKDIITKWLADKVCECCLVVKVKKEGLQWVVLYVSLPDDSSRFSTFFNTFHYMKRDHSPASGEERYEILIPNLTRFLELFKLRSLVRKKETMKMAGKPSCLSLNTVSPRRLYSVNLSKVSFKEAKQGCLIVFKQQESSTRKGT